MAPTPEQEARHNIDRMLEQAGWIIQDRQHINPGIGPGFAVREFPTQSGPADYILFVDRRPVGVIEAKKENLGESLSTYEDQADRYASSGLKWLVENEELPFIYLSTGEITRFWDRRDPNPRAREVFYFHRPETLREWLRQGNTLRSRLQQFPPLDTRDLRDCQINAIQNLEVSFAQDRPRALIQMATGAGKTFTAITAVYRLLKFAGARRILFLVDTRNLGMQAEQEFQAYTPADDRRKFTELYNVQRLSSGFIDKSSQVCISTIQRMYSILRGEELDESAEDPSLYEIRPPEQMRDVVYNETVPIETFDFIVIDECHRSIYNLWRQVLEYFDAFLIGLTATPDNRTYAFFRENVVSEYTHEQAVIDGVNVGYDEYIIETRIGKEGAEIRAEQYVDVRNRLTRRRRWEQVDEDLSYSAQQLDRDIVNPNQIRTVIRAFRNAVETEIFPERRELPKTLIFAKTDSHADDIIDIVREEFGEGNQFCKKVTYGNKEENAATVLQQFRTAFYPRVAVTVDMIATGTDVKPIELLLFMRDVKSRNYFTQMKGRGTRTLRLDDLRRVTPSATSNKTHFVIVDAIGVTKSLKSETRSLERRKSVPLKDLMMQVALGACDEDTLASLAGRLARIDRQINPEERSELATPCSQIGSNTFFA